MPQGAASSRICCSPVYGIGLMNSNSGGTAERICLLPGVLGVGAERRHDQREPGLEVILLRHERRGRGVHPEISAPIRGGRSAVTCWATASAASPSSGPEEQAQLGQRPDRVQPELELGDHAEVAAAAPQPPEQVRISAALARSTSPPAVTTSADSRLSHEARTAG